MLSGYYILKDKSPVKVDIMEWGKNFHLSDRRVNETIIGDVRVSTVFLGMDHRMVECGPPLLFETMIFGGEHDLYCERYSTWDDAEKGHHKACALVVE